MSAKHPSVWNFSANTLWRIYADPADADHLLDALRNAGFE
jgi:hypothetical protein